MIIRTDDAGMSHSVNMALERLSPLPEMSKNRQGELDALTSERFKDAVKARNVQLMTYRQLIEMQGLKTMRRPGG